MNKKHTNKLEDIENEVDSFKPKKRGRPVGSKKVLELISLTKEYNQAVYNPFREVDAPDSEATVEQVKDWSRYNHDWQEGFDKGTVTGYESAQSDMKLANKITLILTAVNVAILISLIVIN